MTDNQHLVSWLPVIYFDNFHGMLKFAADIDKSTFLSKDFAKRTR